MEDIRRACDLMRPVWDADGPVDGYVSIEVDPTLAYDREATFEQAMRLHDEVDKPNLFVKIPATVPGLGAIEDCIAKGKSINVTLIFSLDRYAAVAEAYIRGLERLVAGGGDPTKVASVASFFVSRVDTEADRRLDEIGGQATRLNGKLAIANAKLAYRHWQEAFSGPRWEFLAGKGATLAALPLGLDVDEEPGVPRRDVRRGADRARDGEHDAGRDGGRVPGSRQGRDDDHRGVAEARKLLERLAEVGVDYDDVVETLEARACRSSPTRSRSCWTGSAPSGPSCRAGVGRRSRGRSAAAALAECSSERIWAYDASLWTDSGEDRWLGWLDVVTRIRAARR